MSAMTVMKQIKQERIRQGMNQATMAAKIGRRQTQVSRWEEGTNIPRLDTFVLMCDALGLEPTWVPTPSEQIVLFT